MQQTVYARALSRAAQILGGSEALRAYLNVSMRGLAMWMQGGARPPDHVFLRVVDLLTEHDLKALQEENRADPR
jgi:hypothetical protein